MGYVALGLGVLARMVIPWLAKVYKSQNGLDWQWRYLAGQAIAALIVFLGLPLLLGDLGAVAGWDLQAAFLSGYGVAAIGRFIDKSATE